MELMQNWIRSYTQAALCLCLEEDSPNDREIQRAQGKLSEPENDGEYFRVVVNGPRSVQVVKWQNSKSPIEVILSDSFSTIWGYISDDAARKYTAEKKADVRANTRGAVIKMRSFDILINRRRNSTPKVALCVRSFDVMGCEGSTPFGSPRDISNCPIISTLALRCESIKTKTKPESSHATELCSQIEPIFPHSGSSPGKLSSQAGFVSQVFSSKLHVLRDRLKNMPVESPPTAKGHDLLNMLIPKGKMSSNANGSEPAGSPSAYNASKESEAIPPSTESKPTDFPSEKLEKQASPPQGHSRNPPQVSYDEAAEHLDPDHVAGSSDQILSPPKTSVKSSARQHDSSRQNRDTIKPSRARQDFTEWNDLEPWKGMQRIRRRDVFIPEEQEKRLNTLLMTLTSTDQSAGPMCNERLPSYTVITDPWQGWTKIKKRDVFIPKDQQNLLDSPDSWVPPAPGKSLPPGRVPINLLQEWNKSQARLSRLKNPSEPSESQLCEREDSEEPIEPSTQEPSQSTEFPWSQSPPRELSKGILLPPDSPPPIPTHEPKTKISKCPNHTEEVNKAIIPDELDGEYANEPRSPTAHIFQDGPSFQAPLDEPSFALFSDGCNASDIEISIPRGLETSTQDYQLSEEIPTAVGSSSPPVSPVPRNFASFTQVKRSPDMVTTFKESCETPLRTSRIRRSDTESVGEMRTWTPELVIPATFGSDNARRQSPIRNQPSDPAGKESGDPLPNNRESVVPNSSMAERQLVDELDLSLVDINLQTQHLDFDDEFPSLNTLDFNAILGDTPCPKPCTIPIQAGEKRKSDGDLSPIRSLKRQRIDSPNVSTEQGLQSESRPGEEVVENSRLSFFTRAQSTSTEKIYHDYKNAYPSYEGEVEFFLQSCLKLQALRLEGKLQKSFLWDDFIYREVDEYRNYTQTRENEGKIPEPYTKYFMEHVKSASLKKRKLTAKSIETIVAWFDDQAQKKSQPRASLKEDSSLQSKKEVFECEPQQESLIGISGDAKAVATSKGHPQSDPISIPESEDFYTYHNTASPELDVDTP